MKTLFTLSLACAAVTMAAATPAAAETPEQRTDKRMKAMDKDGDNAVSMEEFTAHRANWTAKREDVARLMHPRAIQTAFSGLDADGDGSISYAEMLADSVRAANK